MSNKDQSFLLRTYPPLHQAGVVLAVIVVVTFGAKILDWTGFMEMDPFFPWLCSASFLLIYIMFNSIFGLSTDDMSRYMSQSIWAYMGLVLLSGGAAYLFSSISINDAASYRWIYIVLTFGYLLFLSIMRIIRRIVLNAENEDRRMEE